VAEAEAIASSAAIQPRGRLRINAPLSFGIGENLDDQCRPNIRAEHDGKRWNEVQHAACAERGDDQASGGAALQDSSSHQTRAESGYSVIKRLREEPP
jgi:hypothetical protein